MRFASARSFILTTLMFASLSALPIKAAPAQAAPARQVVSLNPIGIVFGAYGAEYERGTASNAMLSYGGSLSFWGLSDFNYTSVDAKVRVYPGGTSLSGFYYGGGVGLTHVGATLNGDCTDIGYQYGECQPLDGGANSANAINLDVELGGQWLFGASQRTTFAVGGGAKKLVFVGGDLAGAKATLPFLRLSLGYRFR